MYSFWSGKYVPVRLQDCLFVSVWEKQKMGKTKMLHLTRNRACIKVQITIKKRCRHVAREKKGIILVAWILNMRAESPPPATTTTSPCSVGGRKWGIYWHTCHPIHQVPENTVSEDGHRPPLWIQSFIPWAICFFWPDRHQNGGGNEINSTARLPRWSPVAASFE